MASDFVFNGFSLCVHVCVSASLCAPGALTLALFVCVLVLSYSSLFLSTFISVVIIFRRHLYSSERDRCGFEWVGK